MYQGKRWYKYALIQAVQEETRNPVSRIIYISQHRPREGMGEY